MGAWFSMGLGPRDLLLRLAENGRTRIYSAKLMNCQGQGIEYKRTPEVPLNEPCKTPKLSRAEHVLFLLSVSV